MLIDSCRYAVSTCPECAEISKLKINIFDFSGKKCFKVDCPEDECHAPIWEIHTACEKYRITINCPACDEAHTYTMSKRNFWGKKYFSFNCPTWEVGILYFGKDDEFIEKQMDIQNENINDFLTDFIDVNDSYSLLYELIECINDIALSDNVKCRCAEHVDATLLVEDDKIILKCKNCNSTKTIIPNQQSIDILMKTGTIVLDDTILNS